VRDALISPGGKKHKYKGKSVATIHWLEQKPHKNHPKTKETHHWTGPKKATSNSCT